MTTLETGRRHGADAGGPEPGDARTGTFDALGHRFAVASEDARTIALVDEAFAVLAVDAPPTGCYHVGGHPDRIEVRWNSSTLGVVSDCARVLPLLRAHVQRSAIAAADGDLVLRAGGVERDGRTLLISGSPGCGVSTLVAALVAAGSTYLGDDAIPVDMRSGSVRPFPQPLLLDDRSLDLLPEITALPAGPDSTSAKRLIAMRRTRSVHEVTPRDVSVVLFPEPDPSGITVVQPVDAGDAVVRLAGHAYNFPGREQEAIEALHWLACGADAFSVVGPDPHVAARAVMETLAVAS
jgi:hypothetical protein